MWFLSEETNLSHGGHDGRRTEDRTLRVVAKARMGYDADFLKEDVRVLSQVLMEMEVEDHVGAARHERSAGRVGQRNGATGSDPGPRG